MFGSLDAVPTFGLDDHKSVFSFISGALGSEKTKMTKHHQPEYTCVSSTIDNYRGMTIATRNTCDD